MSKNRNQSSNKSSGDPADELKQVLGEEQTNPAPEGTAPASDASSAEGASQEAGNSNEAPAQNTAEQSIAAEGEVSQSGAQAPADATEQQTEQDSVPPVVSAPPESSFTPQVEKRIVTQTLNSLQNYYEARKTALSNTDGARWQASLFATFKEILGAASPDEFRVQWNALLNFFHEHNDVFNESKLFHYAANWTGGEKNFTVFRLLGYLAIVTADPATRSKNSKRVGELKKVLENLNEQEAASLTAFYG